MSLQVGRAAALSAAVGGCLLGLGVQPGHAQVPDSPGGLPSVSVSASRDAVAGATAPSSAPTNNVTVISEEAIRRSTATSLAEVLATEANLNLHSFYGNDRYANVDMRGMGDTAVSNVLIVVDGEVINENDLSAADLSTVPLSQIERIEVIRGGGSVRYGPGAVGGVISITTRRPEPGQSHAEAGVRLGSYGSRSVRAAVEGGAGQFAGRLQASHTTTNGYRDNSGLRAEQVGGELRWLLRMSMGLSEVFVKASRSRSRNGFPAGLPASVLDGRESERRATRTPYDVGSVDDWKVSTGAIFDWRQAGRLVLSYTHRDRQNPFLMGFEPLPLLDDPIEQQMRDKTTAIYSRREDMSARYEVQWLWRDLPQSLTVGGEWGRGRYDRDMNGLDEPDPRIVGRVRSRAALADLTVSPARGVTVHAGVRLDQKAVQHQDLKRDDGCEYTRTRPPVLIGCTPRYDISAQTLRRWNHRSAELGASWQVSPAWEPFASISRHVRQPNLDEMTLAGLDLRPQRGQTRELGVRYTPSPAFSAALTAFMINITDEIYLGYDEYYGQGRNRNYDWPTRRRGLELDARWRVLPRLTLRGQWAHVEPRFEVVNTRVPLVPSDTVSAAVQWQPAAGWQWTTSARHVSKRMDGNDWSNTAPSLDPYTVVDTVLRYEQGGLDISTGITNVFDEVYTTKAYSQTVYPMPGRGGYVAVNWRH